MPPKKTKRGKRAAPPPPPRQQFKVLLAALFLLAFLLACLLFLAHLRESLQPPAPHPPPPPPAAREVLPDDLRVEVESALLRSGVSLDRLEAGTAEGRLDVLVRGDYPEAAILDDLERRLARLSAALRLERRPDAGEVRILRGDALAARLRFVPPAVEPEEERPRVAIIMDDLGADMETARALLEIDLPVAFAVLPGTVNAARVAELAHRRGREVMIHIPMEPLSYPQTNPGGDALLLRHDEGEIRRRFRGYLQKVPHAVGGNNHMGSRFTGDRKRMAAVLAEMKEADLFFVDSLTSGGSVAYAEALRAGVPAAVRDVFLDNVPEVGAITAQLRLLVAQAVRNGAAVGICHPHPETLEALRRAPGYLRDAGVEAVPVSRMLRRGEG